MATTNDKPGLRPSLHPAAHERRLTIAQSPDFPAGKRVPFIRLKGKRLAKAGFAPAHPVRLRVMGGCIVITLD